jgi:hypothetical protein
MRKPLLLRLYPLLNTATLYLGVSNLIRYSICGVLPVPPTVMFPTQMTGMSKACCVSIFLLKSQFRKSTPIPYNHANGSKARRISTAGFSIFFI